LIDQGWPPRVREVLIRVGIVGAVIALAFTGTAHAYTPGGLVSAANRIRAQYGEQPLRVVPFDSSGDWWPAEPNQAAPTELAELGDWTEVLARLIDPRILNIAVLRDLGGDVRFELGGIRRGPLRTPVVPRIIDPGLPVDLAILLPTRAKGTVTVREQRADSWLEASGQVNRERGVRGTELVDITLDRPAYGATYRLDIGGRSFSIRSVPLPPAFVMATWTFGATMTPTAIDVVRRAFAGAPPTAQVIAAELDGAVTFELQECIGSPGVSCMREVAGRYNVDLLPSDATAFTVLHEFGHVVDAIGLDVAGEQAFHQLFAQSPRWRDCFVYTPLGCVPPDEIFADQFAYWATDTASRVADSYGDPPLADPDAFTALLLREFAVRPGYDGDPIRSRP